jgi:hypothetical protein
MATRSMCKTAVMWAGYGKRNDYCTEANFDVMMCAYPGQGGFNIYTQSKDSDGNFWKWSRYYYKQRTGKEQLQWLVYNSQMVNTNEAYYINPINPGRTDLIWEGTPGGVFEPYNAGLYDLSKPEYCELWAENAYKMAYKLNHEFDASICGIFADSICQGWWWPDREVNPAFNSYVAALTGQEKIDFMAAYRADQVQFCRIVKGVLNSHGLNFGINLGAFNAGEPDFMGWSEILPYAGLIQREHCRLDMKLEKQIFNPNRKYNIGVYIDATNDVIKRTGNGYSVDINQKQIESILRSAYENVLRPNDMIMYNWTYLVPGGEYRW